jgi:hypothetical protein
MKKANDAKRTEKDMSLVSLVHEKGQNGGRISFQGDTLNSVSDSAKI